MASNRINFLVALIGIIFTVPGSPRLTSAAASSNIATRAPDKGFISKEGGFTITLPSKADVYLIFARDPGDQHTTGGMYSWDLKQGLFIISFTEFDADSDNQGSKLQMLAGRRKETVSELSARKGELLLDQVKNLGEDPGWDLRIRYPDELLIERTVCANRRFYKLTVTLGKDKRKHESEVIKILDSFNVTNSPK